MKQTTSNNILDKRTISNNLLDQVKSSFLNHDCFIESSCFDNSSPLFQLRNPVRVVLLQNAVHECTQQMGKNDGIFRDNIMMQMDEIFW